MPQPGSGWLPWHIGYLELPRLITAYQGLSKAVGPALASYGAREGGGVLHPYISYTRTAPSQPLYGTSGPASGAPTARRLPSPEREIA